MALSRRRHPVFVGVAGVTGGAVAGTLWAMTVMMAAQGLAGDTLQITVFRLLQR